MFRFRPDAVGPALGRSARDAAAARAATSAVAASTPCSSAAFRSHFPGCGGSNVERETGKGTAIGDPSAGRGSQRRRSRCRIRDEPAGRRCSAVPPARRRDRRAGSASSSPTGARRPRRGRRRRRAVRREQEGPRGPRQPGSRGSSRNDRSAGPRACCSSCGKLAIEEEERRAREDGAQERDPQGVPRRLLEQAEPFVPGRRRASVAVV